MFLITQKIRGGNLKFFEIEIRKIPTINYAFLWHKHLDESEERECGQKVLRWIFKHRNKVQIEHRWHLKVTQKKVQRLCWKLPINETQSYHVREKVWNWKAISAGNSTAAFQLKTIKTINLGANPE